MVSFIGGGNRRTGIKPPTCRKSTLANVEGAIKNRQSRETGNIDENKQRKNITQYVLNTTIHKQTHIKETGGPG
jgi:hypothetical protein